MKYYAIIKGNRVDTVAVADAPIDLGDGSLWVDVTNLESRPDNRYTYDYYTNSFKLPPKPVLPKVLTKLKVIQLLGADYNQIVSASKTDVDVEVWLEKFRLIDSYVSDESILSDSLDFLVNKNLITDTKKQEILS
jgi:hypothetical protein